MKSFRHVFRLIIACLLLFCLSAGVAFADAPGTPISQALADFAQGVLFPLGNALLLGLIGWAVLYVGKKYKLDALVQYENIIQEAAYKGISMAEEHAARWLKGSNVKITGHDKLCLAISQVLKAAPKLSRDEAEQYVEALLARMKGVGATGDTVIR